MLGPSRPYLSYYPRFLLPLSYYPLSILLPSILLPSILYPTTLVVSTPPVTRHVDHDGAAAKQLPQPAAIAEAWHGEHEAVATRRLGLGLG